MNFVFGALLLFWAIVGIVVFAFIIYNIIKKAHRPLALLPLFVGLLIAFGVTIVSALYYSSEVTTQLTNTLPNDRQQNSSSSTRTLY